MASARPVKKRASSRQLDRRGLPHPSEALLACIGIPIGEGSKGDIFIGDRNGWELRSYPNMTSLRYRLGGGAEGSHWIELVVWANRVGVGRLWNREQWVGRDSFAQLCYHTNYPRDTPSTFPSGAGPGRMSAVPGEYPSGILKLGKNQHKPNTTVIHFKLDSPHSEDAEDSGLAAGEVPWPDVVQEAVEFVCEKVFFHPA